MQLIYGILGLGLVIVIHEAGHFFAARAVGIEVEVFSLGWGKKLAGFTRGNTEYRISWIPLGGFVKMKGETAYQNAVDQGLDQIDPEPGSFFGVSPWRRIIVAIAGPMMNLLFALLVLAIINISGYEYSSFSNRIVLSDDFPEYSTLNQAPSPAASAGLQSGDRITSVNGVETGNFQLLSQELSTRALETVELQVLRDGNSLSAETELLLDPDTGAGILGVFPFIPPVVGQVLEGQETNLLPGDRIEAINGTQVTNSYELRRVMDDIPMAAQRANVELRVLRDGVHIEVTQPLVYDSDRDSFLLGFYYSQDSYEVRSESALQALSDGWAEVWSTLTMTIKGIGLMFQGLNPMNALSGPIKITVLVGEVTAQGLSQGLADGARAFFHLLSLLSVALFFGNLLPIPVLDGGQIVISLAEAIKRRPIHPKAFFRYQTVGAIIVLLLIAFILFGDLLFVFTR